MLVEFEVFKEKKDQNGIPYLYLLRSQGRKDTFSIVEVKNDIPSILGTSFKKTQKEIDEDDWENLTSRKSEILKFIVKNMDTEELVDLENNFYKPEEEFDDSFLSFEE